MGIGKPELIGHTNLKLQLSIRGALYLTTAIAVYAAIVALAYRGDFWGKGITFAVTCSLGVWFVSAIAYWVLICFLNIAGFHEPTANSQFSLDESSPAKPTPQTPNNALMKEDNNPEIQS